VDRSAFDPPPEITSAVVQLDPLPPGTFDIQDDVLLSKIVTSAFMKRRKTIRNSLKDIAEIADLEAVDIDSGLRPEQISILKYVELSNHLAGRLS
jgi:16S rRNA (adenine1518-N6/adenine1519-N6)-dimethyltransferase